MPWWYLTIKAARYLQVAPWELVEGVPRWIWQEWALIVQAADMNVESYFRARATRDAAFYRSLGMM